jgi:hypothetical protein
MHHQRYSCPSHEVVLILNLSLQSRGAEDTVEEHSASQTFLTGVSNIGYVYKAKLRHSDAEVETNKGLRRRKVCRLQEV